MKKNKLINLKEQVRDIRKHGQTNPFNFYNSLKDDGEIHFGNFINIAENYITLYENEPIFNAGTDASKDKYPFILKSYNTINDGDPVEINGFYIDIDQLLKSIEKMVGKYDEALEVLFSGEMNKYTLIFNKVKRSDYCTGSNVQQKIIEYKSDLFYIPEASECFWKCINFLYQKDFVKNILYL